MIIAEIVLIRTQLGLLAGGIQQVIVIDMAHARVPLGRQVGQKGKAGARRLGGLQGGLPAAATPERGLVGVAGRNHLQLSAVLVARRRGYWHWDKGSLAFATWRWLGSLGLLCFRLFDAGIVRLFRCFPFAGLCIG